MNPTRGEQHERTLPTERRRRLGAYYTPPALATEVAEATLARADPGTTVCDPALGGGALLLAAARILLARGADPRALARRQLVGADVDPDAVEAARRDLAELLGHQPTGLRVADSLDPATWDTASFDAVITNPPFLSQLLRRTARGRAEATTLAAAWGDAAAGYADTAGLFLMLATSITRPGGKIGVILPEPLLSTRDAGVARRHVGERTRMLRLWRPGIGAFTAGVRVAVIVARRQPSTPGPWRDGEWGRLAATGVPDCELRADGQLGDLAAVTADFRDQFYGVSAVAHDEPHGTDPRLVTSGLIDPCRIGWGRRPATIGRRRMLHPRAAVTQLAPNLQRWATARGVPKVLVATQTPIIEAAADERGCHLPVVPVITVVPQADRFWHVLAVLCAPPVAAHAHRLHTGAAMSADAIKLSARQAAALPLPSDRRAWGRGAAAARDATRAGDAEDTARWRTRLGAAGAAMCDAYGVDREAVLPWWSERLDRIARHHP